MSKTISSVTRLSLTGGRTVTVWRLETGLLKEYEYNDVVGHAIMSTGLPIHKLADTIFTNLKNIRAVEVIDGNGQGVRIEK
jgi:hypothetical protein